jgi:hypothetical protein
MNNLRLAGLLAGTAEMTVTQAGQSKSKSLLLPGPVEVDTASAAYLLTTPGSFEWLGVSVTTGNQGNGARWGAGFSPSVFRDLQRVVTPDPNRMIGNSLSDSTYTAKIYEGGTADVYRVSNGDLELVRSSTVIGGNTGKIELMGLITDTQYEVRFANFNARNVPYWFLVAAIDSGDRLGEQTSIIYTPPETKNGRAPSNPGSVFIDVLEGGSLTAPANLGTTPDATDAETFTLYWDPVPGAVAYQISIAYADPATFEEEQYLTLEADGGPALITGDMVILTNRIVTPRPAEMVSARARDASDGILSIFPSGVVADTSQDRQVTFAFREWEAGDAAPDTEMGPSYLRTSVAKDRINTRLLSNAWGGGPGQSFYYTPTMGRVYRIEFWVRTSAPTTAYFEMRGFGTSRETLTLTQGWTKISRDYQLSSPASGNNVYIWYFSTGAFVSEDIDFDFADLRMFVVGTDYHAFLPEEEALCSPGLYLRDHSQIKPGVRTTDVESLTNPPGKSPRIQTLDSLFRRCTQIQGNPWIQIEWYHSVEDWLDLLAYICAPLESGHPMALKRAANGREDPWSDAFSGILWEFGNESWNNTPGFWGPLPSMPDSVTGNDVGRAEIYGLISRRAALAMQASPFWPKAADGSEKITWVLGGWARQTYGTNAARTFNLPCKVGIANYNGGWDEGDTMAAENPESYQNIMAVLPASTGVAMDTLVTQLQDLAAEPGCDLVYGETLRPTCYEAGPGYQLNGLNGAVITAQDVIVQEVVMKSRAAATGTLDTVLGQATRGFTLFNFFQMRAGSYWSAYANGAQGGGVYPTWQLCQILNEQMGACEVYNASQLKVDTLSILSQEGNPITPDKVFIYGLRSKQHDGRWMLVIGNRSVSETVDITLLTAFTRLETARVWANTGDYREHNRYPAGTRLNTTGGYDPDPLCKNIEIKGQEVTILDPAKIVVDETLGATAAGLLPGNCLLLQLDGVS